AAQATRTASASGRKARRLAMAAISSIAGVKGEFTEERAAAVVAAVTSRGGLGFGGGPRQRLDRHPRDGRSAATIDRPQVGVLELAESFGRIDHDREDAETHPAHAGEAELGARRLPHDVEPE